MRCGLLLHRLRGDRRRRYFGEGLLANNVFSCQSRKKICLFEGEGEGEGVLSNAAGDAFAGDDPTDICEKDSYKNTETDVHEI